MQKENGILPATGLTFVVVGLSGSLLSIFGAIHPFSFGIWHQSDGVLTYLHLTAGVAAIGLSILAYANPTTINHLRHPITLLPILMAIISVIVSPFHKLPMLNLTGSMELGEGVFSYIDLAIFSASSLNIFDHKNIRRYFGVLVGLITAYISIATYLTKKFQFHLPIPYYFPDYLAFYGAFFIVVVITTLNPRNKWYIALPISLGALVLMISENHGAQVIAFVGIPLAALCLHFTRNMAWVKAFGILIAISTPLAVTAIMILTGVVAEQNLVEVLPSFTASFISRYHLAEIVFSAIEANGFSTFVGNGWGSYSGALAVYLPMDWINLSTGFNDASSASWDAITRIDFHSHNYLIQSLFAVGIGGAVISLMISAAPAIWLDESRLMVGVLLAAFLGGVWAIWFQLAATLPLMSLAFAGVVARSQKEIKPGRNTTIGALLLFGLGVFQIGAGISYGNLSVVARQYLPQMKTPLVSNGVRNQCPSKLQDFGIGGFHLNFRLSNLNGFVVKNLREERELDPANFDIYRALICEAEDYQDRKGSFRLLVGGLINRADFAFTPDRAEAQELKEAYLSNWGERVQQALAIAPHRTDLAAPYLLWLLKNGQEAEFQSLAKELYTRNPNDLVSQWFSGMALLADSSRAVLGLERMKKALANGVERFVPIEDEIKQSLFGAEYIKN